MSFRSEYAVSLQCEDCVQSIQQVLVKLDGIESYDINLQEQRVTVQGRCAPSKIQRALKESGRQVVVRGAGNSFGTNTGAAVCILEDFNPNALPYDGDMSNSVQGLARLVQVNNDTCVIDMTMHNLRGKHWVYVAKTGDLSRGTASTGGVLHALGAIDMDEQGWGDCLVETDKLKVWDVIGRAMVVAQGSMGDAPGNGILAGVIARSAGTWENAKKVCSCSGRNLWEEDRHRQQKGLL